MKRYDGVLLVSDYDGTMYSGGPVGRENIEAVRYFEENGGRFTVATGRPAGFVMAESFPIRVTTPIICTNGTVLYDPLRRMALETHVMDSSCVEEMRWAADHFPTIEDVSYMMADEELPVNLPRTEIVPGLLASGKTDKILKMVVHPDTPEHTLALRDAWLAHISGRFMLERSWDRGLELFCTGTGKGFMVQRLKSLLHADLSVAVGDYENDVSMLRMADIGYAVANALPVTLAAADRVTVSGGENALARIIEEL